MVKNFDEILNNSSDPVIQVAEKPQYTPEQEEIASILKSEGRTDEYIQNFFNPPADKSLLDLYTQYKEQPTAPDPKKLKNNERIAALGQGLGVLADLFGASMGARVNQRNDNPVGVVVANNNQLKDLYEAKLNDYNQGAREAAMRDLINQQSEIKRQNDYDRSLVLRKREKAEAEADYIAKRDENRAYAEGQNEKQYQRQKDFARFQSGLTKDRQPGKADKPVFSAQQKVDINKKFKKIPAQELIEYGVPTKQVTVKTGGIENTQEVIDYENIDYDVMNEINQRYYQNQTQPAAPRTNKPTAGIMPGLKKIKGF